MDYDFAKILKAYRARHIMAQKELAEKIGVNVMTIVRIEKGVKPKFLTAAKILSEVKKEDAEILEQPNSDI